MLKLSLSRTARLQVPIHFVSRIHRVFYSPDAAHACICRFEKRLVGLGKILKHPQEVRP